MNIALVTTAGSILSAWGLAIAVAPWVHARNRRRERWERNVDEAFSLVDDRLDRALQDLETGVRQVRQLSGDTPLDTWRNAYAVANAAQDRVSELISDYVRLERRMRTIRRKSPYWKKLDTSGFSLRTEINSFRVNLAISGVALAVGQYPKKDWLDGVQPLQEKRNDLVKTLREVADEMKLPPRR